MLKFIISVSNLDIKILTYFPFFFRMTDEETPDMCSKKRGRPSGTLNKATVIRNNKILAVEKSISAKSEKRANFVAFNSPGMALRTRGAIETPMSIRSLIIANQDLPKRLDRILSKETVAVAIRVIGELMKEKELDFVVSTNDVFGRAETYLGIGHSKLRELWSDYVAVGGKVLPPSYRNCFQKERLRRIGKEWFGPIREEIFRIRMEEGRAVEVPTLVKWFNETHQMIVNQRDLSYRLKKMGFLFGKMRKLCLRREADDVTLKRRLYLKKRIELNDVIEERIKMRKEWIENRSIGTVNREIIRKYGTAEATSGKMQDAFTWELKYKNEGVYADVIDLTLLEDDTDDEIDYLDDDSDSDIDD